MDNLNKSLGKNVAASHEETTRDFMSNKEIFKVLINDSAEGGAGSTGIQPSKLDHVSPSQTKASPSAGARSENTSNHAAAGMASMETAVDKHWGVTQWPYRDTPGFAKTHKIKLSYKSLAAIPTNTLLLDQQAIDEQVERDESPCDTLGVGVADTHAEMCSPSQLRQQSAELYAVIDEILASSIPESKTSGSLQPTRSSTTSSGLQDNATFPKSRGRETKYASLSSLLPSTSAERKLMDSKKTKPGVIRPMTAIPRLTVADEEEFHPNPFRQFDIKEQTFTDKKKVENRSLEETGKEFSTSSKGQRMRQDRTPERKSPFSVCDLQIMEPEDQIGHPVKDASASFSHTEGRVETTETHI